MKEKLKNFWTLDRHHAAGFTLVELIVVIAILAILAGVAVPAYSGYIKKAEQAADEQLLAALNTAYAAACMENGEYDMKNLSFGPSATVKDGVVSMNKYDEEFQFYFGDGEFKYFDTLGFNSAEGVFKGNTLAAIREAFKEFWNNGSHSFKNEGDVEMLLGSFDEIGEMFAALSSMGGVDLGLYLPNFSDEILKATGLEKIFGDVNGAMNLTDAQLDEYLADSIEGYADKTDAEKAELRAQHGATIKGNIAVMQFAKDAATATPDTVKNDVNSFMAMVKTANGLKDTDVNYEEYYLKMCSEEDREYYLNNPADQQTMLDNFLKETNPLGLSGRDAAKWEAAAEKIGATNTTGTSTLGSLYALAAGYFNATGTENKQPLGTFDSVLEAMSNPKAFEEYYTNQGADDIDAYLAFMGALSSGDVDMTDPNAFGGENGMGDYISGLLK